MLDFLFQKRAVKNAQKFIDQLEPKVQIHVPEDLPLPSVGWLKEMSADVSKINALEDEISKLSDDELRQKTDEFRNSYKEAVLEETKNFDQLTEEHKKADNQEKRDEIKIRIEEAEKNLS